MCESTKTTCVQVEVAQCRQTRLETQQEANKRYNAQLSVINIDIGGSHVGAQTLGVVEVLLQLSDPRDLERYRKLRLLIVTFKQEVGGFSIFGT